MVSPPIITRTMTVTVMPKAIIITPRVMATTLKLSQKRLPVSVWVPD